MQASFQNRNRLIERRSISLRDPIHEPMINTCVLLSVLPEVLRRNLRHMILVHERLTHSYTWSRLVVKGPRGSALDPWVYVKRIVHENLPF